MSHNSLRTRFATAKRVLDTKIAMSRRHHPHTSPNLALAPGNPILSVDGSDFGTWVWTGVNPDVWGVYIMGAVTPGSEQLTYAGNLRGGDLSPVAGNEVCIVGVNAGFTTFQTPQSNFVEPL
jgi:hypothetical protein